MPGSACKVIDVTGTSDPPWEDASRRVIAVAGESLHHLRIAEVITEIEKGRVVASRSRLNLSFRLD